MSALSTRAHYLRFFSVIAILGVPFFAAASDFPTVKAQEQQTRDVVRVRILNSELLTEQQALQAIELRMRSTRSDALVDEAALHKRNIVALEREIQSVKSKPIQVLAISQARGSTALPRISARPVLSVDAEIPWWDTYRR